MAGCPRAFVGHEVSELANLASACDHGVMPVVGGLLDQSCWFVDAWQTLQSEQHRIEREEIERMKRGRIH